MPSSLLKLLLLSLVVNVWSNNCAFGHVAGMPMSSVDYINIRLKHTKDSLLLDKITDETVMGKWKNLWSRSVSQQQQQQPRAVNLFDETFMIDERWQVLSLVGLNLDEANNTTRDEHQLNLASPNQPIKFIKSYFQSGLSLLIVCQMSYCTHYQALDAWNFHHQQLIHYPALVPIDAAYFTRNAKPHLVIAYDSNPHDPSAADIRLAAPSKIYQWNGTRMVFVDEITVVGPKSVVTFENDQATFIVFTAEQDSNAAQRSTSPIYIYQLNDSNDYSIRRLSWPATTAAIMNNVVSIYPYNCAAKQQFFLTINAAGSAAILRWNGAAFQWLANLPNIEPQADQIRILQIDNETLLFVCYADELRVYKLNEEKATLLASLPLPSGQRVIEITAWKYKDAMILLLVKINAQGTFQTELWQLNFQTDVIEEKNRVWDCLRQLKGALDSRAAAIEHFQSVRSIPNLKLNAASISLVEFRRQLGHATVANPRQTKAQLMQLRQNVSLFKGDMLKNKVNLLGNISVANEARIQELHADSLEASHVNGKRADLENYLISGIDQRFSGALSVKRVSVEELSVEELCGQGSDHWMRVNDSARSSIGNLKNIDGSSIILVDDDRTIVIESDLIMKDQQLNTPRINGIDCKAFLESLFIIGQRQTMRGSVRYEGIAQATRLHSEQVNNVASSDLITKPSNQSLQDVFIDALEVEELYVEKINGVAIEQAARMSRENIIKGKVTLAKLVITDELVVEESIALPLTHPTQLYDQIHIDGNVFVKNLELEQHAKLNLTGTRLRDLLARSWTKSTEQLIDAPIALRRGASVDRLFCLRLNGLAERDFLYTDASQLDDLDNVTFAHFHFGAAVGSSSASRPSAGSFVEESNDQLTFRRAVGMRRLAVDTLFADKYNGIPIESIMRPSELLQLPSDFEFEAVRVDDEMSVDELDAHRLNSRSVDEALRGALRTDGNESFSWLSLGQLHSTSSRVNVAKLNGCDLEEALKALEELSSAANDSRIELTIDGRVAIEGNLQVDRINEEDASDYTSRMVEGAAADLSSLMDIEGLVNLTVAENLEVGRVNGQKLDDDLFAGALSRTERQTLDGSRVTFRDAQMNYLTADAINDVDLSKLIYVDRPPGVIYANVSFSHLSVDGHVTSQTFNGKNASKLDRKLRRLPTKSIDNLLVQADVNWDEPSSDSRSLARLLDNAVTKHDDQLIASAITFEKPVVVESLYLHKDDSEISRKINEIVSDTVIDASSEPIIVRGTKIFKRGLIAGNLRVDGNIDIEYVNGLDIHRVASQIFQKDQAQIVTADLTFLDSVEIGRLITKSHVHGVALQQLAIVGQKMPKKLHFQDLHVHGNVSLDKLDGVDFDDFIKRRMTVDRDNEIFVDAHFVHSVRVLNATVVELVNEVAPENLIQNNANGTLPIIIHGTKTFRSRLVVEKNMETALINGFQVDSIYGNAVLNGTDAKILGSLVFEGRVEMSGNMSVSGEINGLTSEQLHLPRVLAKSSYLSKETLLLKKSLDEMGIGETTSRAPSVLYLEEERTFDWHFAGVQSIKSPSVVKNDKTRLEIVMAEVAELCGLPIGGECLCRKQWIVDISPSGEYEIQEQGANNVSNSFYLPEGPYGLKIISGWASYSEQCSKSADEQSKVFWLKFHKNREILRKTPALQINGYVSDAKTFEVDDQLYLIVAIFYDKEAKTHATDSLLYQFDLTNGKASLVQRIPTDGAKSVNVFQIPKLGMHLLIGCVKGRAESLLLRFNPMTRQFQMIRTFATGGSKHVASVSSDEQSFVVLSNPDVGALQIFNYEDRTDTFVDYQIIFFESRVTSLGVFYSGDMGEGDAFVVTTTRNGWLYIYEYMFYGKFQERMSYWVDDIQISTPFRHMNENYLFAGLKFNSTVYKVIQQV